MSDRNEVRASVVVPTRNRGRLIADTVCALMAMPGNDHEILIVDQSTNPETRIEVDRVARSDARVRYHHTDTRGSSAGRNVGAALARGAVVAYTDDDCIVEPDWLSAILHEFEDPRIAAVYGRLLPFGAEKRNGLEVGFQPSRERVMFDRRTPPWYIGHGGNMAFRRANLLAAHGFDPLLGAGGRFGACEDPDAAFRLLARGERVVYSPDAVAYHKHWKDWPAQRRMERAYGIGAGAQFSKYVRSGDMYGVRLFATWMWQLGVRRTLAGMIKWRSWRVTWLGLTQLVFPWVGAARSWSCPIDRANMVYVET